LIEQEIHKKVGKEFKRGRSPFLVSKKGERGGWFSTQPTTLTLKERGGWSRPARRHDGNDIGGDSPVRTPAGVSSTSPFVTGEGR